MCESVFAYTLLAFCAVVGPRSHSVCLSLSVSHFLSHVHSLLSIFFFRFSHAVLHFFQASYHFLQSSHSTTVMLPPRQCTTLQSEKDLYCGC